MHPFVVVFVSGLCQVINLNGCVFVKCTAAQMWPKRPSVFVHVLLSTGVCLRSWHQKRMIVFEMIVAAVDHRTSVMRVGLSKSSAVGGLSKSSAAGAIAIVSWKVKSSGYEMTAKMPLGTAAHATCAAPSKASASNVKCI